MFEQLLFSPWFLPAIFFFVALVYSSVGLGGGSSYTALMAISGMGVQAIPMVSLTLNLIATTAGSFNFIRNGHARLRIVAPFLLSSIPMAYVGGALQVPARVFYWVLLISLVFVAFRIYFWKQTRLSLDLNQGMKLLVSLLAGALLGLLAGIVGIGGGVFLVPLVIVLGLGSEKQAAACGAIFIWLNSLAGLVSRLQYNSIDILACLPLLVAVLAGGFIGSLLGSSRLSPRMMEKILGLVILVAILFLSRKLIG